MIELTVKTLDSQNHPFSIEEEIYSQMTVRQFKEFIAESVNISADSQRLIYCGRVLQNDKKLNDYDVNGKVIHLVQRAPPQPGQRQSNSAEPRSSGSEEHFRNYANFRSQLHGNAMYLGSMSIPSGAIEGSDVTQISPQLSYALSTRRLVVANRMLRKVNEVLDRLDDPSLPQNLSPDPLPPMPQQIQIQTVDYTGVTPANPIPRVLNNERVAEAVSAALNAAGLNNVTVFREINNDNPETEAAENLNDSRQSSASSEEPQQSRSPDQQAQSGQSGSSTQSGTFTNTRRRYARASRPHPRLSQMADLMDRYMQTQDRMRPYVERYRSIMSEDPPITSGSGPGSTEEQQRIVDRVSEGLHYMAHACHSLSDIVVNLNQPPPRHLCCHPIIVQHSAIVQAGIPIQVEAHINLPQMDRNAQANQGAESTETDRSSSNQQNSSQHVPRATFAPGSSGSSADENSRRPDTPNVPQQPHVNITPNPFSSFFTLPNNVEVLMEVSPEAAVDSSSGEQQPQNQNNGATNNNVNHRAGEARITTGSFPWGNVHEAPALVQLMNAVAGHVVQSGVAGIPNFVPGTNQPPSENATSGQNVQARRMHPAFRNNLETHSTNSVLTRTTPRPQVFHPQAHPLGLGGFEMNIEHSIDFDPFLTCNSHHIRLRQQRPTSNTSNNTGSSAPQTSQANSNAASAQRQDHTDSESSASNSPDQASGENAHARFMNLESRLMRGLASELTDSGTRIDEAVLTSLLRLLAGNTTSDDSNNDEHADLRRLTVAQFTQQVGFDVDSPSLNQPFIDSIADVIGNHLTMEHLLDLRLGHWIAFLRELRGPLREHFRQTFPNVCEDSLAYNATNRIIEELRPFIEEIFQFEEAQQSRVNLVETVLNITKTAVIRILNYILHYAQIHTLLDEVTSHQCQQVVNTLGVHLTAVIRQALPGGQASLEFVFRRLQDGYIQRFAQPMRSIVQRVFLSRFRTFTTAIPQPSYNEIYALLVFRPSNRTERGSTSQRSEPEPMEVEPANDKENKEVLEESNAKPEDSPQTFQGHETMPPDWVPVIARDTINQHRDVNTSALTPLSDAYLGGMPSKRRKLIEQQKPNFVVSSTPNSTPIVASLERLVKDGTTRAGVSEVEGAAAAVASDPGVRSAFGQAIRDCLKPKNKSPDFPDATRFPNATKLFKDDDRAQQ